MGVVRPHAPPTQIAACIMREILRLSSSAELAPAATGPEVHIYIYIQCVCGFMQVLFSLYTDIQLVYVYVHHANEVHYNTVRIGMYKL